MERSNIYSSGDIGISGISGIYKYLLYPKYPLYPPTIYIYLSFLGNKGGVFNSNLTVVFIIVSSYKSTSIPYYNTWHPT